MLYLSEETKFHIVIYFIEVTNKILDGRGGVYKIPLFLLQSSFS